MSFSPPSLGPISNSQHFGHAHRDVPLFQPPKSPASVSTTPAFATSTEYVCASKKRHRPSARTNAAFVPPQQSAFWAETPAWARSTTPSEKLFNSAYGEDSSLVNERYRLAGGFDTPSLQSTSRLEQLTVNDNEFRRRLRDDDMGIAAPLDGAIFGPLSRERNGVARIPHSQEEDPQQSWTGFAFGIVGKVFNFGSNVVRGFYAGNGKGYDLNNYPLVGSDLLQEGVDRTIDRTPVPGSWQPDEFLGDFEQDSPDYFAQRAPPTRPSNKRRQTDRETWVLVGTSDDNSMPMSPKRKASGNGVPTRSSFGRPTASRAPSRRTMPVTPRRGNSYVHGDASAVPLPGPQPQLHNRRASIAPTRSPQGRPSLAMSPAYMSPEAERYAKRQAKQERAADKAISSMGRRMEDLIKQAQEALGTKISIEGDGMEIEDEGFVDDNW